MGTKKAINSAKTPTYIADTHALYWYLQNPQRLSPAADAIFRLAEKGGALLVIPAIVIAELYYIIRKKQQNISISNLLRDFKEAPGYDISALGQEQLEKLELIDVDEMHDQLIAADALVYNAIIVTKDQTLRQSQTVQTVW